MEHASPGAHWRELAELAATAALAGGLLLAAWAVTFAEAPARARSPSPVALGRQLFQSKGCVGCHGGPGAVGSSAVGPDLTALAVEGAARRPPLTAAEYVRQSIREPGAFVQPGFTYGVEMPTLDVSERELDALVAFLLDRPS